MKIWLILLLLASGITLADAPIEEDEPDEIEGWEAAAPARAPDPALAPEEEPTITWADTSHAYATDQAQALTEWMDDFFGDPNYDIEKAESLLRLEWVNEFDQDDNYNTKLRLRGKLQLPKVSKRLNLVFSGEDGDNLTDDDRDNGDNVGLLYNVKEGNRSRVDLTLGIDWDELRPGIRYRNQGPISERNRYRYTQRLQYENDEGFYTTGQINLDHALKENTLIRWSNRAIYGEETKGVEWRTALSLRQRLKSERKKHNLVVSYFGAVNGFTDPSYTKNYRMGVQFRRQVLRRYLFVELEPAYNYRKDNADANRDWAWSIFLNFEIALERDLRRMRKNKSDSDD